MWHGEVYRDFSRPWSSRAESVTIFVAHQGLARLAPAGLVLEWVGFGVLNDLVRLAQALRSASARGCA